MLRIVIAIVAVAAWSVAHAQVDPVRRDLVEGGYSQPLQGHAPLGSYLFYYFNRPQYGDADHALRIALSPAYLDGEWAVRNALGDQTDFAVGLSGGGFDSDYDEIRAGRWVREESFIGHDGGVEARLYHLFNPGQRIPLHAILMGGFRYVAYLRDGRNPPDFAVPADQPIARVRAGLRWGGSTARSAIARRSFTGCSRRPGTAG